MISGFSPEGPETPEDAREREAAVRVAEQLLKDERAAVAGDAFADWLGRRLRDCLRLLPSDDLERAVREHVLDARHGSSVCCEVRLAFDVGGCVLAWTRWDDAAAGRRREIEYHLDPLLGTALVVDDRVVWEGP